MKKVAIKSIAENCLFAADVFILFLLAFENRMNLPPWMQSIGRMHPLLLHLPIVLILLAMGMEFFRFHDNYKAQEFYQDFTSNLLLTGALSGAITAIMGLLLSKEEGYTGSTVEWHKWAGVSIVFIASLVYWLRNAKWYTSPVAKISAVLASFFLVVAGHLGAGITHGDNFISAPVRGKQNIIKVPVDKAFIYADVIQPILSSKCMGCHNSAKAKGALLLDNPENIAKGGKDGKIFIAGHADSSLMIERIRLPEEEKKHMPLSGKPQLSKDEIDVLYRWVQSGGDFKMKLTALPEDDSLRLAAAKFLAPSGEENYTFDAADEKKVHELSNNYRVVFPIAKESPALVVDFFNRKQYSSKALEELLPIKKQIIELNLNKMPANNADIKVIAQFENLRTLNLNFTDITGDALSQLGGLKYLKSLSLSGVPLNSKNLSSVNTIKSLREIFVWNTGLKTEDVAQLQKQNSAAHYIEGYKNDGTLMQLNTPILVTTKTVFTDTLHLFLKHPIPGAQIRYTLDGTRPDSVNSPLFNKDLVLDKSVVFKARAFKDTWAGSDSIMTNFYKSTFKPDTIIFLTPPPFAYKGESPLSLTDQLTGDFGFSSGRWVGVQNDMQVVLQFKKPVRLSSVGMHMLRLTGADIYPAVSLQVWGGSDQQHLKLLKTIRPVETVKSDPPSISLEELKFPTTSIHCLKVVAISVKKSPKWGNSPGKPGWVFTDEILLN